MEVKARVKERRVSVHTMIESGRKRKNRRWNGINKRKKDANRKDEQRGGWPVIVSLLCVRTVGTYERWDRQRVAEGLTVRVGRYAPLWRRSVAHPRAPFAGYNTLRAFFLCCIIVLVVVDAVVVVVDVILLLP